MTRLRLLVVLVAAVLVTAACGESRDVEDTAPATAATIEGLGSGAVEIPRSAIEEVVDAVEGSERFMDAVFSGELPPQFRQNVLTQLIQIEAMESLVAENGGEVTDEDRSEIETMLRDELSGLLSQGDPATEGEDTSGEATEGEDASGEAPEGEDTEAEAATEGEGDTDAVLSEIDPYTQLLIDRNALLTALGRALTDGQEPGSQDVVCARHILVEDETMANDLLGQLQGGADFAALATEHSTDTGSGAQGGDLGCAPSSRYVSAFAEAVDAAPLNEVVGPVNSEFGYHLITVYDRRTEEVPVDTTGPAGDAIAEKLRSIDVTVSNDLGRWDEQNLAVLDAEG